jgi:hypothetical protein
MGLGRQRRRRRLSNALPCLHDKKAHIWGSLAAMNAIEQENARAGDDGWWGRHAPMHSIEGYPSQCSVRPGEVLELHISTQPVERYRICVQRLGWYGGKGGRTVAEIPSKGSDLQGVARDIPKPTPELRIGPAEWPVSDVIHIGEDWVSGVYVARLTLTTGRQAGKGAFVPFVVRPTLGSSAAVLVQQPVTTAQAYNNWGGRSLYTSNSTDAEAAVKVSFDRPYPAWGGANLNARWPFVWDYQLLRFLEREGIDVAYTTDVDTHREPWSLAGHRLLMTSGHDEYWTAEIRDAFDTALAEGVNLICMGANTAYWQMRFEDQERTMVEYRWRADDPEPDHALKTELFRNLTPARPECLLWGVQYQDGVFLDKEERCDYQLNPDCLDHPWMSDTGFEHPATLEGLVGYEWDAIQKGLEPADATVFFHYDGETSDADVVAHRSASGAHVLATGSLQFSWGLDDWYHAGHADERLQRFMCNALAELAGSAGRARESVVLDATEGRP